MIVVFSVTVKMYDPFSSASAGCPLISTDSIFLFSGNELNVMVNSVPEAIDSKFSITSSPAVI